MSEPVSECFKRILLACIDNAEPPSEQKEMILIAYENGVLTIPETFALIHSYRLQSA